MTQLASIERFLSGKRIALVGVSGQPTDFSRSVYRELLEHGYDVVPVNPKLDAVEGRRAYARLQDVPEPLDGVIVMTAPRVTAQIVRDCAASGVQRVWMHRGAGQGAVDPEAIRFCEAHQIEVIAGECPLMFLHQSGPHAAHATLRRAFGSYPQAKNARPPSRAPIFAQAFAAWAVSTACLMLLRMSALPETLAFWLHALIAPLVFGASASAYFTRANAAAPMRVAGLNVALYAILDLTVVSGIVLRSWALYTSFAGAYLPLLLVFAVTVVVGTRQLTRYADMRRA